MLPKTSAYASYDGQTKLIYFLIEDDNLLEKCNKVSADTKKEFDSKPVNNIEFLKTKIKSHSDKVRDFYDEKIPKMNYNYSCLAVISLHFSLRKMRIIIRKCF